MDHLMTYPCLYTSRTYSDVAFRLDVHCAVELVDGLILASRVLQLVARQRYILKHNQDHIHGLVQERCYSSASAMELHLSCTKLTMTWHQWKKIKPLESLDCGKGRLKTTSIWAWQKKQVPFDWISILNLSQKPLLNGVMWPTHHS